MTIPSEKVKIDTGPQHFKEIFNKKKTVKPPAYPWQELALQIIDQLNIPTKKKNSVFKVCKLYPRQFIERCFNETKELAAKEKWRYFFKLVNKGY
jgi:hypothetical protein